MNVALLVEAINKSKPIIVACGHISNWEIMGIFTSIHIQKRLYALTKIQTNNKVNDWINKIRETTPLVKVIEIGASLRQLHTLLLKNEIICFLSDQSASPDYSFYVNFFGQKTASFAGPAKLTLKYNAELLFGYIHRNEDYTYSSYIEEIDYSDMKGTFEEKSKLLTARIQKVIENTIRKKPEQWLWFHKRFKHVKNG